MLSCNSPEGPTHFMPQKNENMRMTFVVMSYGAVFKDYVGSNLFVPDNIEFADLQKGAIVEVVLERGDAFGFDADKFSGVIHLVCKADDMPCLEKESTSSLMHYVVDENRGNTRKNITIPTFARRRCKWESAG